MAARGRGRKRRASSRASHAAVSPAQLSLVVQLALLKRHVGQAQCCSTVGQQTCGPTGMRTGFRKVTVPMSSDSGNN